MDIKTLLLIFFFISSSYGKELKKVVILSRHGIRTPLSKGISQMTPKKWPKWKEKNGYLTEKGAKLEGYMGSFFSSWFNLLGLLPDGCPTEDVFYAYSNTKQRTMMSAKSFVDNAFPGCNVKVHYSNANNSDPIFDPVIHNGTAVFREKAIEEMREHLRSLHLNKSYNELENILDFDKSEYCLTYKKCDLAVDKNYIYFVKGEKPGILGPLKIGNSVVDAFFMENYEGLLVKNIAWGFLEDEEEWEPLAELKGGYHNVIFNTTLISKDISAPLVKYMSNIFLNDSNVPKVTLIMGHDANIYTVLNSMGFKPYNLMWQNEKVPISGKVVFQKWFDEEVNKDYLKVEYVYQSTKQIRDGKKLTLKSPPMARLLEINDCKINEDGFCLWNDFKKLIRKLIET